MKKNFCLISLTPFQISSAHHAKYEEYQADQLNYSELDWEAKEFIDSNTAENQNLTLPLGYRLKLRRLCSYVKDHALEEIIME